MTEEEGAIPHSTRGCWLKPPGLTPLRSRRSVLRPAPQQGMDSCNSKRLSVIPAKAGTQGRQGLEGLPSTPAFTGATGQPAFAKRSHPDPLQCRPPRPVPSNPFPAGRQPTYAKIRAAARPERLRRGSLRPITRKVCVDGPLGARGERRKTLRCGLRSCVRPVSAAGAAGPDGFHDPAPTDERPWRPPPYTGFADRRTERSASSPLSPAPAADERDAFRFGFFDDRTLAPDAAGPSIHHPTSSHPGLVLALLSLYRGVWVESWV
jgi:hypothetical protein